MWIVWWVGSADTYSQSVHVCPWHFISFVSRFVFITPFITPSSSHSTPPSALLDLQLSYHTLSVDIPGPSRWTPPVFAGRRHEQQWREEGTNPPQRKRGTQSVSSAASWGASPHRSAIAAQCLALSCPPQNVACLWTTVICKVCRTITCTVGSTSPNIFVSDTQMYSRFRLSSPIHTLQTAISHNYSIGAAESRCHHY